MKKSKPSQLPAITLTENEIAACVDRMNDVDETTATLGLILQTIQKRLKHESDTLPDWIVAQTEMCHWLLSQVNAQFMDHSDELLRMSARVRNIGAIAAAQK